MKKENNKSIQKEAFVEVEQTILGKPKTEIKNIKIKPFVTETAYVEVHAKRHIPLGPNASAGNVTVAVTIGMPCYVEEVVSAYNQVTTLVDNIMSKKITKIQGDS